MPGIFWCVAVSPERYPMAPDPLHGIAPSLRKRQVLVSVALGIVLLAATVGLRFLTYSNDVALMLPSDAGVQRTMRFLHESSLSQECVLSLALNDNAHTTEDLILATDQLIGSLKSPLIGEVTGTLAGGDVMTEMSAFLRYTPQLLTPEAFAAMTNQVTPDGVQERLKRMYRQCMSPSSSFAVPFMRLDPLGVSDGTMHDVTRLFGSLGYDVKVKDGHFVSADGRHTMVILKTPVVMTDSAGARELVGFLKGRLATLPPWASGSIIAGHLHTMSNEDVIKRDIQLTSIVASLAFLSLFLICFRDVRAMLIFATPFAAVVIATHASWLVFGSLSGFVVGLSTVVAGIAIDYGIYVYMAVRRAGNSAQTIRQIVRPVTFGALTTISVFAAFFLSGVAGYRQLALLSNLSILLCLLFSLYVLPIFLRRKATDAPVVTPAPPAAPDALPSRWVTDRTRVWCWVLFVAGLGALACRTTFNEDITQFDGSRPDIVNAEKEFHRVWGGSTMPAMLVAPAKTIEQAYQLNDDIYRAAGAAIGKEKLASLAIIWPSKATRRANLQRWDSFWNADREAQFRDLLALHGQAFNFATNAFQPFFEQLHAEAALDDEPKEVGFFGRLRDRFVVRTKSEFEFLTFFPDKDDDLAAMAKVAKEFPGTFLVSQKHFARLVSRSAMSELLFLAVLGIGATVILTLLLLRSVRLTILALVPVITGLAAILGVMVMLGLSLSIPGIIAALVAVGIVSDYGMFVVYYCKHKYETGTYEAVSLAAVSTFIGAGALLLARHPTLYAVGVAMVTGVLTGYLSSLWIIPPLYRMWPSRESLPKSRSP